MGSVAPRHVGSSRTRARSRAPALAGRFPTTAPPGKPLHFLLITLYLCFSVYGHEHTLVRYENKLLSLPTPSFFPSLSSSFPLSLSFFNLGLFGALCLSFLCRALGPWAPRSEWPHGQCLHQQKTVFCIWNSVTSSSSLQTPAPSWEPGE